LQTKSRSCALAIAVCHSPRCRPSWAEKHTECYRDQSVATFANRRANFPGGGCCIAVLKWRLPNPQIARRLGIPLPASTARARRLWVSFNQAKARYQQKQSTCSEYVCVCVCESALSFSQPCPRIITKAFSSRARVATRHASFLAAKTCCVWLLRRKSTWWWVSHPPSTHYPLRQVSVIMSPTTNGINCWRAVLWLLLSWKWFRVSYLLMTIV
jgi:hypothetical protein